MRNMLVGILAIVLALSAGAMVWPTISEVGPIGGTTRTGFLVGSSAAPFS